MRTTVNYCGNCPFILSKKGNIFGCILASFLQLEDSEIIEDVIEELSSPDWCPLKEEHSFSLIQFSTERRNEINKVKNEIEDLKIMMKSTDDSIVSQSSYKLQTSYSKLDDLMGNEENLNFQVIKSIDEIKEQMNKLEETGQKLQNFINKLASENEGNDDILVL